MWQKLLQSVTAIKKCDRNCDRYYKVGQLLESETNKVFSFTSVHCLQSASANF